MGVSARAVERFGAVQHARRRASPGSSPACCCWPRQGVHASYFPGLFLAFLLLGLGAGASFLPLLTIGMSDAPARDAGLASGIINVSVQLFGAIGLATLGTIATDHTKALSAERALARSARSPAATTSPTSSPRCAWRRHPRGVPDAAPARGHAAAGGRGHRGIESMQAGEPVAQAA